MTKDTDSIAKPFRFPDFFHLSLCWWRRDEGRGTDRGEGVRREEGRGAQSKETHQQPHVPNTSLFTPHWIQLVLAEGEMLWVGVGGERGVLINPHLTTNPPTNPPTPSRTIS